MLMHVEESGHDARSELQYLEVQLISLHTLEYISDTGVYFLIVDGVID